MQENQEVTNVVSNIAPSVTNTIAPDSFSPDNPPWGSWMALLVWFASLAMIVIIPSIGVLVYIMTRGISLQDSTKLRELIEGDPTAILVNVIGIIPTHLLTILIAWALVTYGRKYSFREMVGWKMGGYSYWSLLGIVLLFLALGAGLNSLIPETENDLMKILRSSRSVAYVVAFMATCTAPFVEEVIYRGILYSAFQKSFGVVTGVLLVTILFAAVHVPQYYPSAATIVMICLLSLTLTILRARSKNLWPCIVLHTIFNAIQSAVILAEPYLHQFEKDTALQLIFR